MENVYNFETEDYDFKVSATSQEEANEKFEDFKELLK